MKTNNPSILEYTVVIVMVIFTTIIMLFKKTKGETHELDR